MSAGPELDVGPHRELNAVVRSRHVLTPRGPRTTGERGPAVDDLLLALDRVIDARVQAVLAETLERLTTAIAGQVVAALSRQRLVHGVGNAQLLTVAEAADLLAVSRSTVYVLIKQGNLPAVRIGGARRIPLDAIDAFRSSRGPAEGRGGARGDRAPAT